MPIHLRPRSQGENDRSQQRSRGFVAGRQPAHFRAIGQSELLGGIDLPTLVRLAGSRGIGGRGVGRGRVRPASHNQRRMVASCGRSWSGKGRRQFEPDQARSPAGMGAAHGQGRLVEPGRLPWPGPTTGGEVRDQGRAPPSR